MHASDGAQRRAALHLAELAAQIVLSVLLERNARIAALLRTPVYEAVLAHIEVAATRAAVPVVRAPLREVFLKPVVVGKVEGRSAERDELVEDRPLHLVHRTEAPVSIMDDPRGCREAETVRPLRDGDGVARAPDAAADDGVHRHVEFGEFGQPPQLL